MYYETILRISLWGYTKTTRRLDAEKTIIYLKKKKNSFTAFYDSVSREKAGNERKYKSKVKDIFFFFYCA